MSKPPVSRLGKGLSALIGPSVPFHVERKPASVPLPPDGTAPPGGPIRSVDVQRIRPNPQQPRSHFDDTALAELAASIRSNGVLQPLLLRPAGDEFELVAGERRWRAAKLAGLAAIPAIVRSVTDAESLEIALVENLQREDLNPIERAVAYQRYLEAFATTIDALAIRLGESRPTVSNHLRLLKLHEEIRDRIRSGVLSMGHARAIAGVEDEARQRALARLVERKALSVRQLEEMCREQTPIAEEVLARRSQERQVQAIETRMRQAIGLPIRVVSGRRKNSGRVIISYASLEDFDHLMQRLGIDGQIDH